MKDLKLMVLDKTELQELISNAINQANLITEEKQDSNEKPMNQRMAADYLDISQTTIIKWRKENKIPFEQIPGTNKIRYYKSQLKKVLSRNQQLVRNAK